MTLIATFRLSDCPVLFGDLLVTGPQSQPNPCTHLPAIGDVSDFFGESGWGVAGLHQKVVLISDDCAIAWAGSWLGARIAMAGLRSLAKNGPLSVNAVLQYLASESDLKRHPIALVGFVVEGEHLNHFRFQADEYSSPTLGSVFMAGSGSQAIHVFSEYLAKARLHVTGDENRLSVAFGKSLVLGGLLLQAEHREASSATSVLSMFGGGYEIASHFDGKFRKLADVTYVMWEAEQDTPSLSLPQLVVRQKYIDEHLLIHSARVSRATVTGLHTIEDQQRHLVPPMYDSDRRNAEAALLTMSLGSELMCHNIYIFRKHSLVAVCTLVQWTEINQPSSLTFSETHQGLTVEIKASLKEQIFNAIQGIQVR